MDDPFIREHIEGKFNIISEIILQRIFLAQFAINYLTGFILLMHHFQLLISIPVLLGFTLVFSKLLS